MHTPGHTLESTTYLLRHKNKDIAIFSGDTLFLGDVGRPDLAQKTENFTKEDLAGLLYESLRKKLCLFQMISRLSSTWIRISMWEKFK